MTNPLEDLPAAVQALIVGAVLNVVAIAVFSALPGGGFYLVLLGIVDVAAVAGTVMKMLNLGPWS